VRCRHHSVSSFAGTDPALDERPTGRLRATGLFERLIVMRSGRTLRTTKPLVRGLYSGARTPGGSSSQRADPCAAVQPGRCVERRTRTYAEESRQLQ
jgi:hypothetical protein